MRAPKQMERHHRRDYTNSLHIYLNLNFLRAQIKQEQGFRPVIPQDSIEKVLVRMLRT